MVKVSIIMPVYNCEKYLEECIRSVQRQSLLEWELVCVDDGSTDASGSWCFGRKIREQERQETGG